MTNMIFTKPNVSVIIPVYNAEKYIVKSIETITRIFYELGYISEIIVVDDCSTDDTLFELNSIDNLIIKVIHKSVNQGKGFAIRTGLRFVNYDYCVVMDADLQISPYEIETFFNIMNFYNADVVIGNKRHIYSNVRYSIIRRIVSNGYHWLIKLLFQFPLKDTQCGFKLFKKDALVKTMKKVLAKRFAFDLEVLVAMRENNIRIVDAPVYVKEQKNTGSVSYKAIVETFIDTLAIFMRKNKGWYKDE